MHVITRKRLNDFAVLYPEVKTALQHFLHTENDYAQAVALLDSLIDVVGENEKHPLASLMELVGVLIEQYEDTYIPEITDRELMQ